MTVEFFSYIILTYIYHDNNGLSLELGGIGNYIFIDRRNNILRKNKNTP